MREDVVKEMHRKKIHVAYLGTGERRRSAEEARVCHFLNGLSDTEYEGGVHEGHDDIGVEFLVLSRVKANESDV